MRVYVEFAAATHATTVALCTKLFGANENCTAALNKYHVLLNDTSALPPDLLWFDEDVMDRMIRDTGTCCTLFILCTCLFFLYN
jgi:hypothetical protein